MTAAVVELVARVDEENDFEVRGIAKVSAQATTVFMTRTTERFNRDGA